MADSLSSRYCTSGMASGDSAVERAAAAQARAAKYRIRAERADRVAGNWARGAEGEVSLATVMAPLAADGYYCLADRRFQGSEGNLDQLLVGPAGVFVVDAKSWTGEVAVQDGLRQNGRRRGQQIEGLRAQALRVAAILVLAMGQRRPHVRPVICFVNGSEIADPALIDQVHLLNSGDLVGFVRSFPRTLDQAGVDEVMRVLLEQLPARTAPVGLVPATPEAPEPVAEPKEIVVFLYPWSNYGKRRLYVKAVDGSEIGYLNLATGEVHAAEDSWNPLLAQLLPHYVADKAGAQTEELSGAARGVFRRFLDAMLGRQQHEKQAPPPLLAAYRWKNYGKERLYVKHLNVGVMQDLGWVDLKSDRLQADAPGATPILVYCRNRILAWT